MKPNVMCVWCVSLFLAIPSVSIAADSRLADAAKRQDLPAVRMLLKAAVDVNAPQPDGATALHWAAHWNAMDMAELLLKAKADVNAKNDYDVTPLSLAAENGSETMVQRLLKAGAKVNTATSTGETPLMTAVRAGRVPVVKLLLTAGADVNATGGGRDQTALMWAVGAHAHDIVQVLIENGATVGARSSVRPQYANFSRGNVQGGRLAGLADATLDSNGTRQGIRWIQKGGMTPLILAAREGDLESVKLLVAAGANVNDTTTVGSSALMVAARNDEWEVGNFLLEKGADPNGTATGYTALHLAVARKNLDFVKALLAHGANPNFRLTAGEPDPAGDMNFNQMPEYLLGATPFLLATALNEMDTMRVLAAAGADPKIAMVDGTTPTMAAMGIFPGVKALVPFERVPERGARGDNDAYFQRSKLFSEKRVLETIKLTVALGADVNAARGPLVTFHIGNSRTLVGRDFGDTALHIATADKYPSVAEYLVSQGARMDVKDKRGFTPLAIATSHAKQFATGGDGEPIGDAAMAETLRKLGAKE